MWLANDIEAALQDRVNSALLDQRLEATAQVRGRDVWVRAADPQVAERAAAVAAQVRWVRVVLRDDGPAPAQQPSISAASATKPATSAPSTKSATTSSASSPATASESTRSAASTASSTPTPTAEPTPRPIPQIEPVRYEGGSAQFPASGEAVADRLAAVMLERPELRVTLIGHTDNGKTAPEREVLAVQRAESFSRALQQRGISPDRISVEGRADHEPIADNATESGAALNRRVEAVLA